MFGARHAIPEAKNLSKIYQIVQGWNESPSEYYERLVSTARKYTDLDP